MSYGQPGRGRHVTIYANAGHVFMVVDGRRYDTSARGETGGSRWTWTTALGLGLRGPPPAGPVARRSLSRFGQGARLLDNGGLELGGAPAPRASGVNQAAGPPH